MTVDAIFNIILTDKLVAKIPSIIDVILIEYKVNIKNTLAIIENVSNFGWTKRN
ncbi:hypothetical protein [Flavobacterium cyclinae]|uniref:hypothetical protein n=1 Tax=Flavobacterium cyclinae TaxID=2895947 RepID=UPI001E4C8C0B|nr:hypothetical protein [Flavobacterium cyclinae]UGS21809.1 hypothetical protein LOS86_04070 [Flavobacterium cyclinae]